MEYREIGKTGKRSSIIGLGCENLDGKPFEQVQDTVNAALECGINLFDVFMPGNEIRENIARALGSRRDQVMIQGHIGSTDIRQQYDISRDLPVVKKYFENLLRIFGYIDFGMMFFIDSEEDYKGVFETGFADYVQKLKRQGDIRHIGFSSHNPVMATRVVGTGLPEMMMFSINPSYDYQHGEYANGSATERMALYRRCEAEGVGISVMKAFAGGQLLDARTSPFGQALTEYQCIQYALDKPGVLTVLPGVRDRADLERVLGFLRAGEAERDYSVISSLTPRDAEGTCVYCNHCQPCPAGLDVGLINKYYDLARAGDALAAEHYRSLSLGADACISCGHCDRRCPFHVSQSARMREIASYFRQA